MPIDIVQAMCLAMEAFPYYARGFAAMTPVKKLITFGDKPTLGVDKYWRLYWSPEAFQNFEYHLAQVMCHELEHLLRDHASRRGDRCPMGWNLSADAEINDDIENLPSNCIFPDFFGKEEGLTAEEYYQPGEDWARKCKGMNCEGSGVTGTPEEWEEGAPQGDEAVLDDSVAEEIRDQIASDVIEHAKKDRGSVPEGVLVWAEARAKGKLPKLSWRRSIRDRLRRISHGRQDYSYAKMSRRQDRRDKLLLPGTIQYEPTISVVIDTSGSMSAEADWIAGVLKDLSKMRAKVTLIDCDAGVHGVRALKSWRDVFKSLGGGGTDMRVGVERAQQEKSDVILVLTDGETPWPENWPTNMIAIIHQGIETLVRYA